MARPSKLTTELIDELCQWVADDVPLRFCADGVGITYNCLSRWLDIGMKDFEAEIESLESELFCRIKKTYATVVRESVRKIKNCDKGWTGEAWIRQRRDNEFMDKQEITSGDEKVVIQLGHMKGTRKSDKADS